ncbi:MAG: lysostaphin resistance A-like protein [Anaerolineales bacterium]
MNLLLPWIRIAIAVLVYVVIALAASVVIGRAGADLKQMESRVSPRVLAIGAIGNLCVLASTLLLFAFVDRRPMSALGLSFSARDVLFGAGGTLLIFAFAGGFIAMMQQLGRLEVRLRNPASGPGGGAVLAEGIVVLLVVALQEEVLYRGYVTLNLLPFGPIVVIVTSTILFAAIHVLTNRASPAQIASWLAGGLLFAVIYLVSGSIWVPVLLHFAIDLSNMLVFNIAGQYSFAAISPSLSTRQLATFRAVCVAVLLIAALGVYGTGMGLG